MANLNLKKDDLRPHVVAYLTDSTGGAVDLSSASGVKFIMKQSGASSTKVDTAAVITTATAGLVSYQWTAGDTDTSGAFLGEFEVDWGSSIGETFPTVDYIDINIQDDLGGDF